MLLTCYFTECGVFNNDHGHITIPSEHPFHTSVDLAIVTPYLLFSSPGCDVASTLH